MPSGYAERDSGDESVAGPKRVNHVVFWGAGQLIEHPSSVPPVTTLINPAYGQAALTKLMSLEAEATDLASFNEMAALMEEAPGA